jgi:hypothetical protein
MNDISDQIGIAQMQLVQRTTKLEGQESLKLIEGATGGGPSGPPSQPVSVAPRDGSSVEVVA